MLRDIALPICSPYQQGVAHGRAACEGIIRNIETTYRRLERLGLNRDAAREQGRRWADRCLAAAPAYVDELKGVADGASQDLEGVFVLNFRFEIGQPLSARRLWDVRAPISTCCSPACTLFTIADAKKKQGIAFAGQTLDGLESVQDHMLLIQRRHDSGRTTLSVHEAGVVGPSIGLSSDGFALNYAGLILESCARPLHSLPLRAKYRACLDAPSFQAAIRVLMEAPTPCASTVLISSRDEGAVLIEYLGCDIAARSITECISTHANHPVLGTDVGSLFEFALPDSLFRGRRLERLLCEKGSPSLEEIKAILSDHYSWPSSICLHADPANPPDRRSATLCAVIIDLQNGLLHVSNKQPCRGQWDTYTIAA